MGWTASYSRATTFLRQNLLTGAYNGSTRLMTTSSTAAAIFGRPTAQRSVDKKKAEQDVPTPKPSGIPVLASPSQRPQREKHFYAGRTYAPQNLNMENVLKSNRRARPPLVAPLRKDIEAADPFERLGLKPGHPSLHDDSYKNVLILSKYVTEMGRIKSRRETRLTSRSQREVAKAIRRARSMGLIPHLSNKHSYAFFSGRRPGVDGD